MNQVNFLDLRSISKALLATLLVIPSLASADPEQTTPGDMWCSNYYGPTAVAQNQQNLDKNCGYTGPRWSSDKAAHVRWCINVRIPSLPTEEIEARFEQLKNCPGVLYPAGANPHCNIFSIVSIAQNTANISTACNFTGPRWNSDYMHHYAWCMNQPGEEAAKSELTKRMADLEKCVAGKPSF